MIKNKVDLSEMAKATYDAVADRYEELCGEIYYEKELQVFVDMLPQGAKVLDAGCGVGAVCLPLLEKGFEVVGLDSSPNMLKIAKRKCPPRATFICEDIRNFSFKKACFNGIFCYAVLIHLNKPDCSKVFKKFYDVLKPDGVLFINVMEEQKPAEEAVQVESLNPKYKTWFRYFNKQELLAELESIGFVIDKVSDRILNDDMFKDSESFNRNEFSVYAVKKIVTKE